MNTTGYAKLLDGIKARVRAARLRAVAAVNTELIQLDWNIVLGAGLEYTAYTMYTGRAA